MRILPRAQREAMFEIYAFCRAVDDIADDPGPREGRLAALQAWRSDIDALYAGAAPARLTGLARAVHGFDLQREDFLAIIDGMEMDVLADIRAPDRATLDLTVTASPARSAGFRCGSSACHARRDWRLRIISAELCN